MMNKVSAKYKEFTTTAFIIHYFINQLNVQN